MIFGASTIAGYDRRGASAAEEGGEGLGGRKGSIVGPSHCASNLVLKSMSGVRGCERSEEIVVRERARWRSCFGSIRRTEDRGLVEDRLPKEGSSKIDR